jgi:hypothetical protein
MKKTIARNALLAASLLVTPISCVHAQQDSTISDKEISVLDFHELGYPPLALQTRTQGVVVVRTRLDNEGKVVEAVAISGSELLIPASVANAKKWQFQPNARRVAVIVYNFRLSYAAKCKSTGSFFTLEAPNFATIIDCARTIAD